ncbi:hypothetical protein AC249_AIPGENE7132, partial [Exaiptasia diaphana]
MQYVVGRDALIAVGVEQRGHGLAGQEGGETGVGVGASDRIADCVRHRGLTLLVAVLLEQDRLSGVVLGAIGGELGSLQAAQGADHLEVGDRAEYAEVAGRAVQNGRGDIVGAERHGQETEAVGGEGRRIFLPIRQLVLDPIDLDLHRRAGPQLNLGTGLDGAVTFLGGELGSENRVGIGGDVDRVVILDHHFGASAHAIEGVEGLRRQRLGGAQGHRINDGVLRAGGRWARCGLWIHGEAPCMGFLLGVSCCPTLAVRLLLSDSCCPTLA